MYTYYSRTSKKTHVDGRAKYIPFDEQVKSTRRGHSSRDFCGQELGIFAINHRKNRIEAERDRSILCHWKISKKRIRISKFSFNVILHLGFMELGLMVFRYNSFFFPSCSVSSADSQLSSFSFSSIFTLTIHAYRLFIRAVLFLPNAIFYSLLPKTIVKDTKTCI